MSLKGKCQIFSKCHILNNMQSHNIFSVNHFIHKYDIHLKLLICMKEFYKTLRYINIK